MYLLEHPIKKNILTCLKELSIICGDVTNDVGALSQKETKKEEDLKLGFREQVDKMRKHHKAANFDGDIQPVKLGDASIAAPFTSRVPNISPVLKL